MTEQKCCGNCNHWQVTIPKVIGECQLEMETKLYHHYCTNYEVRSNVKG